MNIQVNARSFTSGKEVIEAAKQRRASIYKAENLAEKVRQLEATVKKQKADISKLRAELSRAASERESLDNIIKDLRHRLRFEDNCTVVRRHPYEIAQEVLDRDFPGVSLADVKGDCRMRIYNAARRAVHGAVYQERDDMSIAAIGRRFERDHTTILHSLKVLGLKP